MIARYRAALDATLYGTALPYGYTLSVWGGGAAAMHRQGTPTVWEAFLFVIAASVGYGILRLLSHRASRRRDTSLYDTTRPVRTGAVQVAAITGAVGAAALAGGIDGLACWTLAGFGATVVYLGITGVDMALVLSEGR